MKNLTLLTLAVLAAAPLEAQRDGYDWSGSIPAGATLRVSTGAGDVNVTRAPRGSTATVRGRVRRAQGNERIRFELVREGQNVTICALYTERATCTAQGIRDDSHRGNRHARADFTVEVPAGVLLAASSGTGDVDVSGATASVRASTGNGDVRVGPGAAEVNASSGNGTIQVQGARGAVRASSGNGQIDVATSAGPVTASSGNGDIRVSMASLRSTSDLSFSSGNGDITLRLPSDFSAELQASTGSGSVRSDFEVRTTGRITAHRLRGTIGRGGRSLRISTGSGSIALERAGGAQ
ncbi:MAG TPA: DUF4097 family beta strand repeat-containing protein [Longimicrobium sp.]